MQRNISLDNIAFIDIRASNLCDKKQLQAALATDAVKGRHICLFVHEALEPSLVASIVRALGIAQRNGCASASIGAPTELLAQLRTLGLSMLINARSAERTQPQTVPFAA